MEYLYKELTERIISAFYEVYNTLGVGFLEKVYEKSLLAELNLRKIKCKEQARIDVFYKKQIVGEYYADLIIEDTVIVELKASEGLVKSNEYQLKNYLKATKYEVGLLLKSGKTRDITKDIH
ncbi:MAG: GxxExxY protein [Candidatus Zophobacter franzmannii]|nr:GxxExxY protein [Candidatus Zophobacter franzmannii]